MISHEGRIYTVYKHTNKVNGKVYIGLTCQNPERRWQRGAGYAGTYFGNAIKKYGWDGFAHEILHTGLMKEEACACEKALITAFKSNDREFGYNTSEGGETCDCIVFRYGKDNPKATAVIRINPTTGERRRFESVADAVREMHINHRGICKACRGHARTYMGFVWEYDKPFEKPHMYSRGKYPHTALMKKVKVIEIDGTECVFACLKDAGKAYGHTGNTISRYISGERHDPCGRMWVFV